MAEHLEGKHISGDVLIIGDNVTVHSCRVEGSIVHMGTSGNFTSNVINGVMGQLDFNGEMDRIRAVIAKVACKSGQLAAMLRNPNRKLFR